MKKGWTYKKLGELYPIIMGKTPPRNMARFWDTKKETHNLWVSIADLSKNEGKEITDTKEYISDDAVANITKIAKGSLLVSFKLTLGKMAFAGDDLYTNEAIMSLGKRDDINLKFLYYYFSSLDWGKLAAGNEKVKGKTLNKKSLSEIPIAYLPLSEQQRIVERLDAAFAHIDELKANAEKQLSEARVLFQKALEKAMEPKEGWEESEFKDLCSFIRGPFGGSLKKECFKESGYAVYEQQNAIYDRFTFRYYIDKEKFKSMSRFAVKAGDLIMSCSGTIGKVAIIPNNAQEGIINQALLKLTPKEKIDKFFLKYLMESEFFKELIAQNSDGAAIKNIASVAILKELKLAIPSIYDQRRIVARLDSLSVNVRELEEVNKKTIAECDALKQAILRQVFE